MGWARELRRLGAVAAALALAEGGLKDSSWRLEERLRLGERLRLAERAAGGEEAEAPCGTRDFFRPESAADRAAAAAARWDWERVVGIICGCLPDETR